SPAWWAHRLSAVRTFARHLHAIDPSHQVPPPGLLATRRPRATPYLYSDADIAALMTAARGWRSPLRAVTFETLVGLLAVTGIFSRGQPAKGAPIEAFSLAHKLMSER
ncbi:MAG: hypothetical protein ACRDPR_11035, partial [Nocardioidaceae bacterium]